MSARSVHYVNNKDFLAALKVFKRAWNKAKREKTETPVIPEYLGECFLKIAEHLSYKPNFINYIFREEMICDGVENCVQYMHNFNPRKSENPFAYFTQIIYYAFLRRIQKEKKQLYIKMKSIEKSGILEHIKEYDTQDQDDKEYKNAYLDYLRENLTDLEAFFERKRNYYDKKPPKGLESFMRDLDGVATAQKTSKA